MGRSNLISELSKDPYLINAELFASCSNGSSMRDVTTFQLAAVSENLISQFHNLDSHF